MAQAVYWTLSALLVLAIFVSGYFWARLLVIHWPALHCIPGSLVPIRRRRRPFWTPADFLVMFGTLAVLSELIRRRFVAEGWIEQTGAETQQTADLLRSLLASTAASVIAGVGALTVTMIWLRLCNRYWWKDLGLSLTLADLRLGGRGALMILPPVLLISAAASRVRPYHHPVLDSLAESNAPLLFLAIFLSTAILTPIVEEFTFRVLLQGGLQGIADRQIEQDGLWQPKSYWPLIATSALFAMMHFGQGAAPIPLFFLSLGIGYLYRQTGRLAVPVVVHVILNGLTLCVEFSKLQLPS